MSVTAEIKKVSVGRSAIVHVAFGDLPRCDTGAGARGGSSRRVFGPVTCKRCLRIVPTANQAPADQADATTAPAAIRTP